ncbi:bifunctional diguanylate cyclase/phosphodiesterase [Paraglaciecola hydrolytica]|uniref:Diguanylate phosphodiesterase n=1 Tax=Paraglaciecola hydrolytica TaxID=1799789 RepID=A0A136A181_9ALTE|nr:EAL domain-containing protein [Paraglaciecola hydrolytica]KXI28998.1 diguanylate phosphodiesterase [Paraglaciecola hydrolytica]
MPLSRQLILSLFSVLLAVFLGTLMINVSNTKDAIEQQLASHAQDTATSFGLSITPYIGDESDLPLIETMMNAIFDRGFYRSIVLKDYQNTILLEKHNPESVEGVPTWFMQLFPLNPPVVESEINNGWTIAAVLTVQSNPSLGYQQLWRNMLDVFALTSCIFVFALGLLLVLVRLITVPISAVVKQVEAMSEQKFEQLQINPRTRELKVFVKSFNKMSERLNDLFTRLSDQTERYRQFAYSDNLTKVGNRRAFDLAFDGMLSDAELQPHGFLLLIRLSSLSQVNSNIGFVAGDDYIKGVCKVIHQLLESQSSPCVLYRLNGADFCVLLEDIEEAQAIIVIQSLMDKCKAIEKLEYESGAVHIGAGGFTYGDNKGKVLEKVDSALTKAVSEEQRWQIVSRLSMVQSNDVWREKITLLLKSGTADFVAQPIKNNSGEVEYQEWFARFRDPINDQYLPMAELIPVSIRLDFAQKLDELLVLCALEKVKHVTGNVGLNVSRLSLLQPVFQYWLMEQLFLLGESCQRLILEIPERALLGDIESFGTFVAKLKTMGVRITIERFGAQFAAFTQLRKMRPDYLKLDGRYIKNIDSEEDNQLFVHSLVNIAHGLGIKIIAERVETEQEAQILKGMQVDFVQGYFVGEPIVLKS